MRSHALGAAGALVVAALLLIGGPARFVLADDPPPVDPPASDPAPVPPPPDFISPLAGPSIYPDTSGAYLQYPTLTYGLRSGNQLSAPYQTAFKDGDQTYLVLTLKDNAASITSVVADFSALGIPGPTSIPLAFDYTHSSDHLYQFQTDYFPIDTHGANGPGMVTITATDANGQSVSQSIPVVIDNTPPTLSITSFSSRETGPLKEFSPVALAGIVDGTGSDALFSYDYHIQPLDAGGAPVALPFNTGIQLDGGLNQLQPVHSGVFQDAVFPIRTPGDTDSFDPTISSFQLGLTLFDGAGNAVSATTSPLAIVPPAEPDGDAPAPASGISNVLFLPGIEGSRLYRSTGCNARTTSCAETKLWDPGLGTPLDQLYLDSSGQSAYPDVYAKAGDIVSSAGGQDFYTSFVDDMNELEASTTFAGGGWQWQPVAYDWRLSLNDLVNKGADNAGHLFYEDATSTPYIEQTLRSLAASSKSGKVTIIAHSNGGLVAKALMEKLGNAETARLIDKVIFVGVPQSGAPQAVGGLLFGYGAALPIDSCSQTPLIGFLCSIAVSRPTARELAENSPMAYHLLPSATYFQSVRDNAHPVISFDNNVIYEKERAAYGPFVDSEFELSDYLTAQDGSRTKPAADDIGSPNVLSSGLLSYAQSIHSVLDAWTPPSSVTLYQIAGWGDDTISGIEFYRENAGLFGTITDTRPKYRPTFVEDGDGLVPVPSALMMSETNNVKRYWFDLARYATDNGLKSHRNIFQATQLRSLIFNLLKGDGSVPSFISTTQPSPGSGQKLLFFLHSPLTLELYDADGNRTGPSGSGTYDQNIPNTEYGQFGDVQYLIAPAGQQYHLVMHGQASGAFSLDIEEQTGDTIIASTTIADVPTTARTLATLDITNGIADATPLTVDEDGDGTTDITLVPQAGATIVYQPTAPANEPAAPTQTSIDTRSRSSSSAAVTSTTTPFVIPEIKGPTVITASSLPTLKINVASTPAPVETEGGVEIESVPGPSATGHTQTASVYDAGGAQVLKWLEHLLYNVWHVLAHGLNYLLTLLNHR